MPVACADGACALAVFQQAWFGNELVTGAVDLPIGVVAPGVDAAILGTGQHETFTRSDFSDILQRYLRGRTLRIGVAKAELAGIVFAPGPQRSVGLEGGGKIAAGHHLDSAVHHLDGHAAVDAGAVAELAKVVVTAGGIYAAIRRAEERMIPACRGLDGVFELHFLRRIG